MSRPIRIHAAVFAGVGMFGAALAIPALAADIDTYVVQRMQAHRVPGVVYAVVENGKVAASGAHGFANLETQTPMTLQSVFDLASLTKPFTATAILLLVEQGKLQLDTPIASVIADAPETWRGISVRHLLTHTAGFPEELDGTCDGIPLLDVSAARAYASVAAAPLLFAPGDRAQYSDPGYILLGAVIERASGASYREFVQRHVFDRLGMTASSVVDQRRIIPNRVAPYAIRGGELLRGRRDWQVDAPAAFGIWSTVGDVARFDAALDDTTFLAGASRRQMWTLATVRDGSPALVQGQPYGFGWTVAEVRGHPAVWHGGFSGTMLLRLLEDRVSVIVLTNLDAASGRHMGMLARGIAGIAREKYRSVDRMQPAPDASPDVTRAVRTLLGDLAAGRASAVMTPAYRAQYDAWPAGRRDGVARSLGGFSELAFLASDDCAGRGLRFADPIARITYYRCETSAGTQDATVWMAPDGRISALRLDPH